MTRFIIPIFLVASAVGLFMLYTDPRYQEVKDVQKQVAAYDEALDKSQELKKTRDQLLSRRNTFPTESLQKLEKILPDNVDNIRLIIDINAIAARHLLSIKNIELGEVSDSANTRSAIAVGSSGSPVGSVTLGFSVSAGYEDFLAFLQDLEHSLRVVDIENITFTVDPESGLTEYTLSIRTYWLH
jgi:Tfp pilus assembly protein PilO